MRNLRALGWISLLVASNVFAAVPDTSKATGSVRKNAKAAQPKIVPIAPVVLAALSDEQLQLADKVHLGTVACELGAKVNVKPDTSPGRFLVEMGRNLYRMEPTPTTTGAVRLEDPMSGAIWLQLGNKSMLLDTRAGKRLADACVNAPQAEVASAMERNKGPGLLDEAPIASGR
jgi:hypothetical protein